MTARALAGSESQRAYTYSETFLPLSGDAPNIFLMTIRGKEIQFNGPLVKLLVSQDVRAAVAIGFFVAYLGTALVS